jgi:hypothetical protein
MLLPYYLRFHRDIRNTFFVFLVFFLLLTPIRLSLAQTPTTSPPQPPPQNPSFTVKAAAIKLQQNDYSPQGLVDKITTTLQQHPDADILVTPEYVLYTDYLSTPVKVDCSSIPCSVSGPGILVNTISDIQNLARDHQTNIVLGTVAEVVYDHEFKELTHDIVFNSQLIINHRGEIVGVRRKTVEWFSTSQDCENNLGGGDPHPCYLKASQLALNSVMKYQLYTHPPNVGADPSNFTILPTICGERANPDILNIAQDFAVDMIVHSEREGDSHYEWITQSIQDHVFDPTKYGWDWMINDIYIQQYTQDRQVAKDRAWFIASEGGFGMAGIINLRAEKLQFLDIANDYVYGHIAIRNPQGDLSTDGLVEATDAKILLSMLGNSGQFGPGLHQPTPNSLDYARQVINWQNSAQLESIFYFDISGGESLNAQVLPQSSIKNGIDCMLKTRTDCILYGQIIDDRPGKSPFDSQYSWHLDPHTVAFVSFDQRQPECDVLPSIIEQDLDLYLSLTDHYCQSKISIKGYQLSGFTTF